MSQELERACWWIQMMTEHLEHWRVGKGSSGFDCIALGGALEYLSLNSYAGDLCTMCCTSGASL
jgi:hypothetical protein